MRRPASWPRTSDGEKQDGAGDLARVALGRADAGENLGADALDRLRIETRLVEREAGQAHGLSFSVQDGVKVPPSLANIYKELASDLGLPRPDHGNLSGWARQGVLLLNAALTVEQGQPASHQGKGWEEVTDAVIAAVAAKVEPCVFLLWGNHARKKAASVPGLMQSHHLVLTAPHPSPLSAHTGFLGCRHFSQANTFLEAKGRGAVDWRL